MAPRTPSLQRPRIYGHRGCRGLRPENTLAAFLHALEWPIYGLELDVVLSADGEVVVSHEPWLNADICLGPDGTRLTPEQGRGFNLYQQPYAAIKRCDCGSLRHPAFPEQQLMPAAKPLLSEVFEAVAQRAAELRRPVPAYSIELKSEPHTDGVLHPAPAAFVARVLAELSASLRYPAPEVLIMSFDHRVVQATRQLSDLPVCLLIEDNLTVDQHIAGLGFVPDVLGPKYTLLTPELLRYCRLHDLPIVAWTVNDPVAIAAVAKLGVRGITTDYPDRAVGVLGA
ncbi:glycerophosphodiester phosphodiesterase family protein [Hymenobacter latericus]|uniref:glycerophosphodiester phosphodiesterase family protein n=1 Tax=Hymenobacter sp. YIM 151858-1 TaxID=2987688 RepID=UPI002227730E|nr:glycerophosphodiester phosphodiesterase family protein [Hymenobacter sp. YIM 151858-1]UYZ58398.1 glycerophosphodiester phosphodiesterase family protein [Hymenobacter sp. YIM 151858-1]